MRVLLATDGSAPASAAVDWLRHLPFPSDRDAMVVCVVPPSPPRALGMPDVSQGVMAMEAMQARRVADDTASQVLTGRRSVGRVVRGDPQDEIIASATQWGADVIVLGTRGLGVIKGFFLASVSLGVVRNAPCPVLVCKGMPREVRTVTVALDGSAHARQALDWLAGLPLAPTARVRLVGVVEPELDPSSARDRRDRLAAELVLSARTIEANGVSVETTVTTGTPARRIVEDAERHGSDLLVVGARGAGAATRLLLGSVSESVLRRAQCPVLVVRPAATGETA
jgi:nucleotide-binding universal stress UspA family protein